MACNDTLRNNEINYNGTGLASSGFGGGCSGIVYIHDNLIENNNTGILLQGMGGGQQFSIYKNCICSNAIYNFQNLTAMNINAGNNCWCLKNLSYIQTSIYDAYDDVNSGIVTYNPIDTVLCQIITGIAGNGLNLNLIYIFPNPSNGQFKIETSLSEKQTLQLFDLSGKLVLSKIIIGTEEIDASNLDNGIYTLTIKNSLGIGNKKLVIAK